MGIYFLRTYLAFDIDTLGRWSQLSWVDVVVKLRFGVAALTSHIYRLSNIFYIKDYLTHETIIDSFIG